MKKLIPIFVSIVLTTTLCSCPYESPYNLDEEPLVDIDENLVGNWAAMVSRKSVDDREKEEPVKVIISKRTDKEYDIAITGYLDELKPFHVLRDDTIKGTAYLSSLIDKRFLNTFIGGRVYIAEVVTDTSSISILPLAEYFTSKLVKNSKELRTAVTFHYKVRHQPGYDPLFCLKNLQRVN